MLRAPPAEVSRVINTVERAYLTHINTPQEVVIGGDPAACKQVISTLNCSAVPAPYSHVIHCPPMRSEQSEFKRLNTIPLTGRQPCNLYFAAQNEPGVVTSESVGQNIATAATQQVDFPGLIQRAYNDGSRIFVELGPLAACTVWIDDILKEQPHLAVSINRRSSQGDRTALVKMLAQLAGHRVSMDLSSLYVPPAAETKQTGKTLIRTVSLLEKPISDAILSVENRAKFSQVKIKAGAKAAPVTTAHPVEIAAPIPAPVMQPARDTQLKIEQKAKEITMNEPFVKETKKLTPVSAAGAAKKTPGDLPPDRPKADSDFLARQLEQLNENNVRASQAHVTFLQGRTEALQQMSELIKSEGRRQKDEEKIHPSPSYSRPEHVIWDEDDLLEFARGEIAPVFGPEYAIIDTYSRRVRLPTPPYLLVSRITKLQGQRNVFEPSKMTTEYDIPFDAWYSTDGQIPWAVSVESGQCDLMLISYLGIDFQNKGERVYRLLDCTLTFLEEMPLEGHTLRYDISIDSFAKSGESLLFFFSYNCFVGDTMVLKMRGGCAGFFTDEELAGGKGIITTAKEKAEKAALEKQYFEPLLRCARTSFNRSDLLNLVRGDIAAAFGEPYNQRGLNPSLRLPPEGILMVDRITEVDPHGGAWGLGLIVSEKDLEPNHWYFPCHFSDDQVMAGSLVAEGCSQMLQFYLLYLGFQLETRDARFQPVHNLPQVVRTRKQITACSSKLIYRMEITEIGTLPHPCAKANVDIIFEGRVVVDFKNLGLQLTEKKAEGRRMKDESRGQGSGVRGQREEEIHPSHFPPSATAQYRTGGPALFDDTCIENFAVGSISACFGPAYKIFKGRRIPRTPNGPLKLISRIVEINAERLVFSGQPNLVSEYDVPVDPWFCQQNSYATTPYSIFMEIGLQPCGFLSAWLGSTLPHADEDFYFRNLDGEGLMIEDIDVRGKTISNRVALLSATAIKGIIIQKFSYQLETGGQVFYKGTAVFGYFQPQALANQVGLDQGKMVLPWVRQAGAPALPATKLNLTDASTRQQLYKANAAKPFYRLAGNRLDFLDEALIISNGGKNQQGYIYAGKKINPQDWFFKAHFYQDPVMPGSLGVEAILQALQIFALNQDLGAALQSPHFTHVADHQVVWIYRGQIIPDDGELQLEIHITNIEHAPGQVTVFGDAGLWKGAMRIYEVRQVAVRLLESGVRG